MATNPMQRKSRNAFLLGVVITLIIAAIIVFFLFREIQSQQEEIDTYELNTSEIYVLNQSVTSGQVLTTSMFTKQKVSNSTIPSNATTDIVTTLASYSLCDTNGNPIYVGQDETGSTYYYIRIDNVDYTIYVTNSNTGSAEVATNLTSEDEAFYYAGANNTERTNITIATNAIVAKVDMEANTVITTSLITRADERTTDDLRQMEYNVITLPVDLFTGDYIDIRLRLPNGQDYIVVSKKQVTIPMANGSYLTDTIQINLTEDEILLLSCAIVENFQMDGSMLYAVKYTEAGLQEEAQLTYYPNNEVVELIRSDPNIVSHAINEIGTRSDIYEALEEYGDEDNIASEVEESITATQEAREDYLQSLTTTTTTTN